MQLIFYELIQKQTEKIMLAEIREEYVFKIIDPAIIPEKKAEPRRSVICITITSIGFILAVIFAQFKYFRFKK